MKKLIPYLLFIPVIYSGFMLAKSPTISDAIIVSALCAFFGFITYANVRYDNTIVEENKEVAELEESLRIERLKLSIESMKQDAKNAQAMRDARNSAMNYDGKQIKF